jgi:hypothetical protein
MAVLTDEGHSGDIQAKSPQQVEVEMSQSAPRADGASKVGIIVTAVVGCLTLAIACVTLGVASDTSKYVRQLSAKQVPTALTAGSTLPFGTNPCKDKKPLHSGLPGAGNDEYFKNKECMKNGVVQALEQAGANVTKGYKGKIDSSSRTPILDPYWKAGLCPVNVHWHLGAEHLSVGEYDDKGTGPKKTLRRLAGSDVRQGLQCRHYNAADSKFTKEYDWKHCVGMQVGQTYEVHWPHSAAGACGTPHQYQYPFYDGVFCRDGIISLNPVNVHEKVGVQAQVYTIVNDESYYYPDMMRGMIVDGDYGKDVAKYTGSTTGTSRSNTVCSWFTPITWQVDRKCHLISASSFDKMCADMKAQRDDMSKDLHAHGAREVVADNIAGNNMQNRV